MKGANIFKDDDMIDYLIHDNFFSRCSQEWLLNFSKTKHIIRMFVYVKMVCFYRHHLIKISFDIEKLFVGIYANYHFIILGEHD